MQLKLLFSASLLGAAVALPGGSSYGRGGKQRPILVDANFDNLPASAVDLEPVGDYDYLYYQGFSVGTPDLARVQVIGVEPHSPPNVAYSDAISSTFAGPALVAHYSGSKTKNFDLKSFYYACVDVSETPVATAENCTVTVTGYVGDLEVASQNFTYGQDQVLTGNLDATMDLAVLDDDFTSLTEVDFTYTQSNNIDSPPSLLLDNVKYLVYLQKKAWSL